MAIINLTGKKFGRLTATSLYSKGKRTLWNTVCECGGAKVVEANNLKCGNTTSCGCFLKESQVKPKTIVVPGKVYSKLTVIKEVEKSIQPSGQTTRYCLCKCECGREKKVAIFHLIRGKIKSCGCNQGEQHGMSNTLLYHVWHQMIERCHKVYASENNLKNYQSRGISVCQEWQDSFKVFYSWCIANGWQAGLQIDRKNNDGNYEPSNCRFVTRVMNANNKRNNVLIEINGEVKTIAQWSLYSGIGYTLLRKRFIDYGWTGQKLFTPARKGNYRRALPETI